MKHPQGPISKLASLFTSRGTKGLITVAAVLVTVALFLVPLNPWVLDFLLVFNIVIALTLLIRSLSITSHKKFLAFPTILLFTTLFRLALNVSSTQLILLRGGDEGLIAAGRVIRSFGQFVVGGDFVVGAIIFAIIAVVNFVVIAKGSARVAEVSARFTLDALPGKQLAIDADLRAGNITREEAHERRAVIAQESEFYGAMDGAMKFVQGDAVAGLVITFINAVGGVSIGLGQGMSLVDAVDTFGILTIGDGLVSILPSLLISVCAGIVVTHVNSGENSTASEDLFDQLIGEPTVPVIISMLLIVLAATPWFPFIPFFGVGLLLLLGAAYQVVGSSTGLSTGHSFLGVSTAFDGAPQLPQRAVERLPGAGSSMSGSLVATAGSRGPNPELLRVEVDPEVIGSYLEQNADSAERCLSFVDEKRAELYSSRGILLPDIRFRLSGRSAPGEFKVLVREQAIRYGTINPQLLFAAANPGTLLSFGIRQIEPARHPLTCAACCWIDRSAAGREAIKHLGIELLEPYEYMALEAYGAAFEAIDELFGLDEAMQMVERLRYHHAALVDEVLDGKTISAGEFAEILRRLVRERVSVRDIKLILEGIAEFRSLTGETQDRTDWLSDLHAFLRVVLSRGIVGEALSPAGALRAFVLSSSLEEEFRTAMSMWDGFRSRPPIDPGTEVSLKTAAQRMFQPVLERGSVPIVVLCPAEVRPAVQEFFGSQVLNADCFRAIAYEELGGRCRTEPVGVLHVGD